MILKSLPSVNKSFFPGTFWLITIIKLCSGTFFASHYVTGGFLPFIQHFVSTGGNPYDYFFVHGTIVFPYPAGMLLFTSAFLGIGHVFIQNLFSQIFVTLFLFRIPILLADIAIYIVLCKLLPTKEKKVLWLYYASPILFYINYYHGQLDVIPTALLIVSLYLLSIKKEILSYLILGVGLATKTHLLIALPFYAIYLYRQKMHFYTIVLLTLFSLIVFVLFNIPFLTGGYLASVFNNAEQQRLFYTFFPYQYKDLAVLIAPAALLACFYMFASTKRLNFDSLILTLGLVYTVLIALVPPMQGWFYWSIPLFTFFLIKYKDSHLLSFFMMNIFFIAFFIFTKDSDIFESASLGFLGLATIPTPFYIIENMGGKALLIQNVLFTCLQVSVAMNAFWCYKIGIFHNNLYIDKQQPFILGIGGDSGVGKSTFAEGIKSLVGKNQIVILNGDDSHKWERHDTQWQYFTHLNPKANNLHKDVNQIYALVDGKTIERATYNHKNGKFSKPSRIEKNQFILFQGLHPFFLDKMRSLYNLKIFMEADSNLQKQWKLARDVKQRGHAASEVKSAIKKRKVDAAKFIEPQKKLADWIIRYSSSRGKLIVTHTFSNTIALEDLLAELYVISGLTIKHQYLDIEKQIVIIEGHISRRTITKIAYKLYPDIAKLITNQPEFKDNMHGINQLFFVHYLNFYFSTKRSDVHYG